ncbi:MAG: YfcE family phosphodiesterase [Clostridiales bacterium]|nr:YfcE family phosphodiesterase [Clostridiales bacterium]
MSYKLIVISDIHYGSDNLVRIIPLINESDYLIFCGDGLRELMLFRDEIKVPIVCVKGNGDYNTHATENACVVLGQSRALVVHGHRQNVRRDISLLMDAARIHNCQLVFFGHTHVYYDYVLKGIHFINPGALCEGSYATVTGDGQTFVSKQCIVHAP